MKYIHAFFAIATLCVLGWATYATIYGEINEKQYAYIGEWAEKHPDIQTMVEDATWEDDTMDMLEYTAICKVISPLQKEQEEQERQNPTWPEIGTNQYAELRDWAKQSPVFQRHVRGFIDDGTIDTAEYDKLWVIMKQIQRDKLIQEVSVPMEIEKE